MAADLQDDWENLVAYVRTRLVRLGLTNRSKLAKVSGVSDVTWRKLLDLQQPVTRAGKPEQIMDVLGWTYESWGAMLGGGKPTLKKANPQELDRIGQLESRVAELEATVRELRIPRG